MTFICASCIAVDNVYPLKLPIFLNKRHIKYNTPNAIRKKPIRTINSKTICFSIVSYLKIYFQFVLITHNDLLNAVLLCERKDNKFKQQ